MATIDVKDAAGATVAIERPLAPGQAARAASRPVTISTEDMTALTGTAIPAGTNNIGDVDVLTIIPATGATNLGKAIDAVAGATDTGVAILATRLDTLTTLTPASGDYASPRLNARGGLWIEIDPADVMSAAIVRTVTTQSPTYTRPGDTTAYAAGDALSNSTSAPTAGGLTFTVASASGKGGIINGLRVVSSNAPGTPLQGELWLFDTAPTAINDNAAFTVSDAEMLTWVATIPFALATIGANSSADVDLNKAFTTVGATTLRGLVRVTNAYTPANAEVISFRLITVPVG